MLAELKKSLGKNTDDASIEKEVRGMVLHELLELLEECADTHETEVPAGTNPVEILRRTAIAAAKRKLKEA